MSDFSTVLVVDSKIADVTPEVVYAVKQGAASNTYQTFKAVSSTPTSVVHSIQVPSESVLVSREVIAKTIMTISSTHELPGTQAAQPETRINLNDFFIKAFPFNSSIITAQCNINNTTVSVNLQDIRQALLKLTDIEEYQKYAYGSPVLQDIFFTYSANDSTLVSDVYGNFRNTAVPGNYIGGNRGFRVNLSFQFAGSNVNVLPANHQLTTAGLIQATANSQGAISVTLTWTITTYEPLLGLSPFLWSQNNEYNNAAIAGINGINFNFNMDSTATNVLINKLDVLPAGSTAAETTLYNNMQNLVSKASITSIDSSLIFNFLSTQSTQLINAKNVCPYQDFPRYITRVQQDIAAGVAVTISSQTIQINQIPDYFIVFVRERAKKPSLSGATWTPGNPERYLHIERVNVNFNNSSGLLSSCDPYSLWQMSVKNGSQQTYNEYFQEIDFNYLTATAAAATAVQNKRLLLGSILVIDPQDLSLPPYLSSGSIGQYIFQIDVSARNFTDSIIVSARNLELVIICVNSGIFTTIAGSSSISTALLSKQVVMQTAQNQSVAPLSRNLYNRMVGGSLQNRISSAMRKMMPRTGGLGGVSSGGMKKSGLDNFT